MWVYILAALVIIVGIRVALWYLLPERPDGNDLKSIRKKMRRMSDEKIAARRHEKSGSSNED